MKEDSSSQLEKNKKELSIQKDHSTKMLTLSENSSKELKQKIVKLAQNDKSFMR